MNPGLMFRNLIDRAKRLLLQPQTEWQAIDAETMTVAGIYKGWVLPLAAIPALAGLIGTILFGLSFFRFYNLPRLAMSAVSSAVIGYLLALAAVFVLARVIDALAPNFGGTRNGIQALKVAAFSMTATWLAGIFFIIPPLSGLAIVGLYGLYLMYLGLPMLMRVPKNQALGYVVVTILAAVALIAVVNFAGWIASWIFVPRRYW